MEPAHTSLSILIVEDEHDSRETLVQVLSIKYPEIDFLSESTGRNALECYKKHRPPIVITDVNMPEMDGIELSCHIKAIHADVRFIVISAHTAKNIPAEFAESGVHICNFVTKPVDLCTLFSAIDQCVAEIAKK